PILGRPLRHGRGPLRSPLVDGLAHPRPDPGTVEGSGGGGVRQESRLPLSGGLPISLPRKGGRAMARQARAVAKSAPYDVHPSVAMVRDWIDKLPEKPGRSLEQWLRHIREAGPPTEAERRDWLKKQYQLGTNSAWWLAERAEGKGT